MTVEQLQQQNNISNPRIISVGQQIIVQPAEGSNASSNNSAGGADNGGAAAEDTGGEPAAASATPVPPTPTPAAPAPVREAAQTGVDPSQTTSELCAVLFEDANQNRLQEDGEDLLDGGSVALSMGGQTLDDSATDSSDAVCFDTLAAGDYVVSAEAPGGYGFTTPSQLQVRLAAGETLFVAFGAAEGIVVAAVPTANAQNLAPVENDGNAPLAEEDTNSPLNLLIDNSGLIVFGLAGVVMVIGFGITLFGLLRRR
ncbi:MAG: SdrD B-like domain-containing protein [Anaerolineae bacterium]